MFWLFKMFWLLGFWSFKFVSNFVFRVSDFIIMTPIIVMNLILVAIAVLLSIADRFLVTYGECKVIINKEKELVVTGGSSLLSYFVENKIFIPSACGGKATCGYCKVKVLSGGGDILPTEEVYIPKKERIEGLRLACQVKVKNDIEIYIPEDLLHAQEFKTATLLMEDLTHDIKHIVLKLIEPANMQFKPGQYIQFKVPGTDEFRAYSIASVPSQQNMIELIVRLVPGGLCSTYIHEVLDVNDEISITGPYGEFFLREDSTKDIVCIGGGCGMAPMRSIIYYLREKGMPRKIMYFFGARRTRDLFYTEELFDLHKKHPNFRYIPALSEPKPEDKWEGETGLITQVVERYVDDGSNMEAYLCGPGPMIDASIKVLSKKGMAVENILYDKF